MWEMVQVQVDATSFCIHYCNVLLPKLVHMKLCIEIIAIYFGSLFSEMHYDNSDSSERN